MTHTDLNGRVIEHPEHGEIVVIEYNHHGQMFCYGKQGEYYTIKVDDDFELLDAEIRIYDDKQKDFIDFVESLFTDPKAQMFVATINEDGSVPCQGRNMAYEDMLLTVQSLYFHFFPTENDKVFDN